MFKSVWIKIFLAAVAIRILYSLAAPAIYYFNADTIGYYSLGTEMFLHPSLATVITPYRMPAYPLFLNTVMYILGAGGTVFGSPAFLRGANIIVAIQMIVGAAACTIFSYALSRFFSRRTHRMFILFLLFDVLLIGWERTLLTEGLTISISLILTALLFSILHKPAVKKFFLFLLVFAVGFLLRPSFVILPAISLPIIAWFFRKRAHVVFLICITIALSLAIPLTYARANYTLHGYSGIQFVGDIDILGRILVFQIPVESAKNNTYFYNTVIDSRTNYTTIPTGFQFLEHYDPNIWGKVYRFVELQAFNRTVLIHNLPLYITKAMATIPEILLEVCEFILVMPQNPLRYIQSIYSYAQYATLLIPFLWIVSSVMFVHKPTLWNAVLALTGTIATSQIVLTALVVYKDIGGQYGRILSVVLPHMFLFLFMCFISAVREFYKKKRKI